MTRSPSSSPLRKKPRLSSPTYDGQFPDLESHDFQALDDIEIQLSREVNTSPSFSHNLVHTSCGKERRKRAIEDALKQAHEFGEHNDSGISLVDGDGIRLCIPMTASPGALPQLPSPVLGLTSVTSLNFMADRAPSLSKSAKLASAASLVAPIAHSSENTRRPPSPEITTEQDCDHDAWFSPTNDPLPSASALGPILDPQSSYAVGHTSGVAASVGFKRASGTAWAPPSATTLEMAKKKLEVWEAEIECELSTLEDGQGSRDAGPSVNEQTIAVRDPLKGVENSVVSPTALGFTPGSVDYDTFLTNASPRLSKVHTGPTSLHNKNASTPSHVLRSFISNPILVRSSAAADITLPAVTSAPSSQPSPTTPVRLSPPTVYPPPQTSKSSTLTTFTPPRPAASAQYQGSTRRRAKPLGLTPRAQAFSGSGARAKFVTPFKQGMGPNEPGRGTLVRTFQPKTQVQSHCGGEDKQQEAPSLVRKAGNKNTDQHVFNLAKPSTRTTLADCGLTPQYYIHDELAIMGFGVGLFKLTSVSDFLYYRFKPADVVPTNVLPSTQISFGPESALEALLGMQCHLATKAWVDNHWSLILWKMIGMACLERLTLERKWCWSEVLRQLRYRYARELANGSRPALRLITTQDAPPSGPLVLCVSNIFWTDECVDAEGRLVPAHPELELTDGWYRLRAIVDEALARAARKKVLRIGRKLACSGTRLESSKKDPMEVLDAYASVRLVLSGNSTHLAPWHAKLGFQTSPFVATLGSLSLDGGGVALMDLVVTQVFPVAFIEFITTESGDKIREGPRTEKEEAQEEDKWRERRSHEAAKLRDEAEKKLHKLESYADKLDRITGSDFQPNEDGSSPDNIDDLAEELEDSEDPASFIKCVDRKDAGWLSLFLRKKCVTDRQKGGEEIDRELATSFPARDVRNFRVVRVKDAQTVRKPSWRTAQLTVWDVMSLNVTEGGSAGSLAVGQRYMVTSLVPSQQSAWMGLEPGSEVYLSTRRDTKWKIIN